MDVARNLCRRFLLPRHFTSRALALLAVREGIAMLTRASTEDLTPEERLRRARLAAAKLVASGRAQKIGCPPNATDTAGGGNG